MQAFPRYANPSYRCYIPLVRILHTLSHLTFEAIIMSWVTAPIDVWKYASLFASPHYVSSAPWREFESLYSRDLAATFPVDKETKDRRPNLQDLVILNLHRVRISSWT